SGELRAFECKEAGFGLEPALTAIAAKPGLCQHAVARDHDRDRVFADRPPDRARRRADRVGDLAIGPGLAVRDFLHRRPNLGLERRPLRRQRQLEIGSLAGEIFLELARSLGEDRAAIPGCGIAVGPADRDDLAVLFVEPERTDRACNSQRGHWGLT